MDIYRHRSFLVLCIGLVAILYVLFSEADTPAESAPCNEPLHFYIDQIDPRFGVSEAEVKQAFQEGAKVWSDAAGKTLAVYHEEGEIPIRLIYDDRQQLVDGEFSYREQIKSEEIRIELLQNEFRQDSLRYEQRVNQYEHSVEEASTKIDNLNAWVTEKNESGGFLEEETEVFDQRKAEIDRLEERLSREDRELTSMSEQLNQKIDRLNRMIDEKNRMVDRYNETYSGEQRFAQGTFEWTGEQRTVSIHQFSGANELRLVLAHELGHALGLDHVENPQSVMYPEMTEQPRSVLQLTEEDRQAIRQLCGDGA
ncbi:MAG: matrixin family metalloprotease [Balneolaceae bacterium]